MIVSSARPVEVSYTAHRLKLKGSQHGILVYRACATRLLILAAAVFLEAIGLPIPAALALLIAGGAAAHGVLQVPYMRSARPVRDARRRHPHVPSGPLHRLVALGNTLPHFAQPGILHLAIGGFLLPPRPDVAGHRKVHSRESTRWRRRWPEA